MNKFTPEQISHMLSLQDELNCLIHPEWKEQEFEWNIAALAELVEIKEWLGWKWWKKGYKQGLNESNIKQVQIEVIDILHFWLSEELKWGEVEIKYAEEIANTINRALSFGGNLENSIKAAMRSCIEDQGVDWYDFGMLAKHSELTPEVIYETYIAKYTLNIFRQNHGYKTGEYKKHWLLPVLSLQFQEDNWFLEKALEEIKKEEKEVTIEEINNRLEYWYGILEGGK